MIKNMLGKIGIINRDRDPINYRERAPLVLPPKMDLRSPAPAAKSVDAEWPNDPDVARRRKALAPQGPAGQSDINRMAGNNPRLSVEEIRQGRTASAGPVGPVSRAGDNSHDVLYLSPDELRSKSKAEKETTVDRTEPKRSTLTDPPDGMRKFATGTSQVNPSMPRIDQQEYDANPLNWIKRKFGKDEDE